MQTYLGPISSREGLGHINQEALMGRLNGQETSRTGEYFLRDV